MFRVVCPAFCTSSHDNLSCDCLCAGSERGGGADGLSRDRKTQVCCSHFSQQLQFWPPSSPCQRINVVVKCYFLIKMVRLQKLISMGLSSVRDVCTLKTVESIILRVNRTTPTLATRYFFSYHSLTLCAKCTAVGVVSS